MRFWTLLAILNPHPVDLPPSYNSIIKEKPPPYEHPPSYEQCFPKKCKSCGLNRNVCGHPQSRLSKICIDILECCCKLLD
uniref:Uncharacterized protein n=1 Tax=Trichogramma kaykai TaxID=54128 RepID=A0ABD2WAG4_9HYME